LLHKVSIFVTGHFVMSYLAFCVLPHSGFNDSLSPN